MTKKSPVKGTKKALLDGDALFEAVMENAVSLKGRPAKPARKPRKTPLRPVASQKPPRPVSRVQPAPAAGRKTLPQPTGGLDKRSAERLRRGQMNIEARLDLHGHTQADAHRAAHAFIAACHRAGRRCVLIITGKGGVRDDFDGSFMPDRDSGVLRRNLPRWLAEAPMRPLVLRLESARPQHGGDGAYYVLLRRKR